MTSDPVRLLEDASFDSALRADLGHASQAQLHGFDHAAGLAKLQAATSISSAGTTTGMSLLGKVGLGATAVAGLAVGAWMLRAEPEPTHSAAAAGVVSASAETTPRVAKDAAPLDEIVEPAQTRSIMTPMVPEETTEHASAPTLDAPPEEPVREPAPKRIARRKASSEQRPAPKAEVDDSVLREAKMVAKARAAVEPNPTRALSLVHEAEREFGDGQLLEERSAIEIRALVGLGRMTEAKQRAKSFLAKYGRGAHAAAVRRAVGENASP